MCEREAREETVRREREETKRGERKESKADADKEQGVNKRVTSEMKVRCGRTIRDTNSQFVCCAQSFG